MKKSFPQHIAQKAKTAQKYILDTNLNEEVFRAVPSSIQDEYKKIRDERVIKGQIVFRSVEIIFSKEQLEYIIEKLLIFEGYEFFIRYYDTPQTIPILHLMSFDSEHFYLGGFYPSGAATEEKSVYITNKEINNLLQEYWQMLWLRAKPLNELGTINWDEVKNIGKSLAWLVKILTDY